MQPADQDLVSTATLAARLGNSDLRVVDATWLFPSAGRSARAQYEMAHIAGAVYFDLDLASNPGAPFANTLPSAEHFAAYVGSLGIDNSSAIVLYDQAGLGTAPRAWWMFRVFGHARVAVLDGGLSKWRREGRAVVGMVEPAAVTKFHAAARLADVASFDDVRAAATNREQIVDARPAARFAGTASEPRAGLRSGHIPGSFNIPHTDLVDPREGTLLEREALAERFAKAGVATTEPTIATCGSGVSACVLAFALRQLGNEDVRVYDGSWTEWATRVPAE